MGIVTVAGDSTKNTNFGGGFKPKTPGWYDVRCIEVPVWEDPNQEKPPAIRVVCEVLRSEHQPPKHIGEKLSGFMSLGKDNAGRWRKLLDQAGVQYTTTQNPDGTEGVSFDPDHLLGRCFRVKIEINEGSGKHAGKSFENWADVAVSNMNPQAAPAQQYMQAPPGAQPAPQGQPPYAQQPYAQPPQGGYMPPGYVPPNQGR